MKNNIRVFLFTLSLIASTGALANPTFVGFKRSIEQSADELYSKTIHTLSDEDQLACLNLLAFFSIAAMEPATNFQETIIKCLQTIHTNQNLVNAVEQLDMTFQGFAAKYIDIMYKKFEKRASTRTEELENEFLQKIEQKILELFEYFYQLSYSRIYNNFVEQKNILPMFMFNEQGIIPIDQRTQSLPKPTL